MCNTNPRRKRGKKRRKYRRFRPSLAVRVGYSLPVVALTAYTMIEDREKFIAAGGDDYITKPPASGALANLVKRWTHQAHGQTS